MNELKKTLRIVTADFAVALTNKKVIRFAAVVLALTLVLSFGLMAFASNTNTGKSDIGKAVEDAGQTVWNVLMEISIPVGLIVIVAAGILLVIKHGERDIDRLKSTLLYVIVGYFMIFLAPYFIKTIVQMFKGQSQQAWDELKAI